MTIEQIAKVIKETMRMYKAGKITRFELIHRRAALKGFLALALERMTHGENCRYFYEPATCTCRVNKEAKRMYTKLERMVG